MKRGQQTRKTASPGTTREGLGLTPQLSAEEISRRDASLTCVVSITSLKAERPEPSEIDHHTISQQQQQRSLGQRTEKEQLEGIYNRKSGERMSGQDNPLSDRRHCWLSFHAEC